MAPKKSLAEYAAEQKQASDATKYPRGILSRFDVEQMKDIAVREVYFRKNNGNVTVDADKLKELCDKLLSTWGHLE